MKNGDFVIFKFGSNKLYQLIIDIEPETNHTKYYVTPFGYDSPMWATPGELELASPEFIAEYVAKRMSI